MASQEHLQMLYDDDDSLSTSTSTSNSSSSDDDDETSSENEDMAPMGIPVSIPTTELLAVEHDEARPLPAKKRIKLSLQLGRIKSAPQPEENGSKEEKHQSEPLPEVDAQPIPSYTEKKSLPPKKMKLKTLNMEAASTEGPSMADDEGEVEAMVVDGDEVGEDDAVAAVVEEAATKEPAPKKRTTPIVRSVRMPPIPSPGLLLLPGSGGNRGTADENGLVTPASLFDNAMSALGYTIEERTTNPHRGSSVKKEVGDMFDSNVKFSLHFPELVPAELLSNGQKEEETDDSQMNGDHKSLPERLIRAFATTSSPSKSELANRTAPPKRRKLTQFSEMVPLSLAMPYPEEYIQKRLEYIEKIKEREKAIIVYQEEDYKLGIQNDLNESLGKPKVDDKPKITVPPIPEPPTPPRLADIDGLDLEKFDDHYPLYFPKGSEPLFAHLDKSCFHVTDGRYFGLLTASIADPQFVGPLAPGVTGNFSQGTALNTACSGSGGGSSGGALQATPQVVKSATNISAPSKGANAVTPKSGTKKPSPTTNSPSPGGEPKPSSSKKKNGPTITASSSELRKIMEEGGELAEKIKKVIIRSAVHASRAGKHGISFRAPNGQTYPDVSKAFAVHAGLKPCNRCKNNKQGAYHCRLRRKHQELDYDGSDSPGVLAPLFQVSMEELLWKKT